MYVAVVYFFMFHCVYNLYHIDQCNTSGDDLAYSSQSNFLTYSLHVLDLSHHLSNNLNVRALQHSPQIGQIFEQVG